MLNGEFAGRAETWRSDGTWRFAGLLDVELLSEGANDLALSLLDGSGTALTVGATSDVEAPQVIDTDGSELVITDGSGFAQSQQRPVSVAAVTPDDAGWLVQYRGRVQPEVLDARMVIIEQGQVIRELGAPLESGSFRVDRAGLEPPAEINVGVISAGEVFVLPVLLP